MKILKTKNLLKAKTEPLGLLQPFAIENNAKLVGSCNYNNLRSNLLYDSAITRVTGVEIHKALGFSS